MSAEQKLLRIGLPEGVVLRGADFREELAKRFGEASEFFHRDSYGLPKEGEAKIRTVSGKGWVGVLAMPGLANTSLLEDNVGKILSAANKLTNRPLPIEYETREFGVEARREPVTYFVRECAIKRRTNRRRSMTNEELAKSVVVQGMNRIAVEYGFDLPTEEDLDVRILEVEKARGLRLRTTTGTTNEYAHLMDFKFTAFVDLKGVWQVGNLLSRGYGRIGKIRGQLFSAGQKDQGVLK